jgi:four helix bundle protein
MSLVPDPAPDNPPPSLAAERMDCYQLALEFESESSQVASRAPAHIRSQFQRASLSIVLNIAEGTGRWLPSDKARFYSIARGSATECAAILDVLRLRRLVPEERCRQGRGQLLRIVQMLTRLEAVTRARDRSERADP